MVRSHSPPPKPENSRSASGSIPLSATTTRKLAQRKWFDPNSPIHQNQKHSRSASDVRSHSPPGQNASQHRPICSGLRHPRAPFFAALSRRVGSFHNPHPPPFVDCRRPAWAYAIPKRAASNSLAACSHARLERSAPMPKSLKISVLAVSAILLLTVFLGANLRGVHAATGPDTEGAYRQMRIYGEVLRHIQTDYVEDPKMGHRDERRTARSAGDAGFLVKLSAAGRVQALQGACGGQRAGWRQHRQARLLCGHRLRCSRQPGRGRRT